MTNNNSEMTPEEQLLDNTAQSILRHVLEEDGVVSEISEKNDNDGRSLNTLHDNTAEELNASDADGMQGGQVWTSPTVTPTVSPTTTSSPSNMPTFAPNLRSISHTLRGLMWYDRNANGVRDSNVEVEGFSNDVEFEFGVGGISVSLVECDPDTGEVYVPPEGQQVTSYASTMTVGYDALMKPQIVPSNDMGGKFNIYLEELNRYYMVSVTAPSELLFTSGVCNNDIEGWGCNEGTAIEGRNRRKLLKVLQGRRGLLEEESQVVPVGIRTGRSTSCVFVNNLGEVQESLSFGVMREGDTSNVETNVALVLEFDDQTSSTPQRMRHLSEIMRRATVIDEVDDGHHITTRYLLADEDRLAIGTVTAEVTATALDSRLADNGVNLDSVDPKEVIMSNTRPKDGDNALAAAQAKLAVGMEIRGHYSPPPNLDFDYIVQDSINRDTATIRRGLREYNRNCRDQTTKVNQGSQVTDFEAVVSTSGAARPGRGGGRPVSTSGGEIKNVFSTACSSDFLVPQYFETSLKDIETRDLSEVQKWANGVTFLSSDDSSGLDSWAMGPVAGLTGLIVLLMGVLVFRRALGPRRVDKYEATLKTNKVDKDETRRFGEAGGDMDDGSVDSAFYSDSDDSDLELTEKERKMRRKRKQKEDEQRQKGKSGTKSSRKSKNKGDAPSSARKSRNSKVEKKLEISQGSDDTDSLEKYSNSSASDDLEKKHAAKERAMARKSKASSSSNNKSSKSSSSKRGRSKQSGGDNARIV